MIGVLKKKRNLVLETDMHEEGLCGDTQEEHQGMTRQRVE
jgi:hypothetical protein